MMRIKRKNRGFTLIELLIVIAIIGILAAIAIPAYTGYTKKTKVSGVVHAMGGLKNAVTAYLTERGSYNRTVEGFDDIKNTFGFDFPNQYVNDVKVEFPSNSAVTITATLANIGSGVDESTLILQTNNWEGGTWSWGGNVPEAYRPKQ